MMVLLAAVSVLLLVVSEIVAIAPVPQAKRLRMMTLWCALPTLILFGLLWLVHIRAVLSVVPDGP
jgi:hypothetical protein